MATPLQRELKKRKPFESAREEAHLNLVRTHGLLSDRVAQLFKEHGLSAAQYNVLRILRGEHPQPLACQEISERMVTREPDLTRLLDRMEKLQLTTRRRDAADRRVVLVSIAPQGLARLAEIDRPLRSLHDTLLGHLSRAEIDELNRLLVKARQLPDG